MKYSRGVLASFVTTAVLSCVLSSTADQEVHRHSNHHEEAEWEPLSSVHESKENNLRMRAIKSLGASKKGKKGGKKGDDKNRDYQCGVDFCAKKVMNMGGMYQCLEGAFERGSNLYFPSDGGNFLEAIYAPYSISRRPAAIVFAEDVEEVKAAVKCAVDNGYKVTPRGAGHSYQGLSTMDGHVVIDMKRTCKPEQFVIDKTAQGPHLLEGTQYIGTIKAQAGCTNAIMLAHAEKHFGADGGMALIGSCPSVGITGFVLGGGGGDISPFVGYGADIVKAFDYVLYDGTSVTTVTASEDENEDLYWASRGGGGGNGIITHLTYKIVQAPKPPKTKSSKNDAYAEDNNGYKFTFIQSLLAPFPNDPDGSKKVARFINHFFYEVDSKISSKFGGGGSIGSDLFAFLGIYLGSWKDAIKDLEAAGIFDEDNGFQPPFSSNYLSNPGSPRITENFEVICEFGSDFPYCDALTDAGLRVDHAIEMIQFDSYAELLAYKICDWEFLWSGFGMASGRTWDACADLEIDASLCEVMFTLTLSSIPGVGDAVVDMTKPKSCLNKDVIAAMLEKAADPKSFLNIASPQRFVSKLIEKFGLSEDDAVTYKEYFYSEYPWFMKSSNGGNMVPRTDDETLARILDETSVDITLNHLQHAAGMVPKGGDTAYPHRESALMIEFTEDNGDTFEIMQNILRQYAGVDMQGYYAYLNPPGMQNWRTYYFGDNYEKLTKIRGKYDPLDVFGSKPLTPESVP